MRAFGLWPADGRVLGLGCFGFETAAATPTPGVGIVRARNEYGWDGRRHVHEQAVGSDGSSSSSSSSSKTSAASLELPAPR